MAKIKPQALLLQSKKKKGPTRVSITTIVAFNLILALIVLTLVATYRHWSQRATNHLESGQSSEETEFSDDESKKYDAANYAVLTTTKGVIIVELHKEASPEVVHLFCDLCKKGYFKAMPFHHVIKNYVIQSGKSQNVEATEEWTSKGKTQSQLIISPKHEAFMVGTPKSALDTKELELFITTAPIPNLKDKLVLFGRVTKGEEVVQEIEEVDTDEHYQPKSPIGIIKVELKQEI